MDKIFAAHCKRKSIRTSFMRTKFSRHSSFEDICLLIAFRSNSIALTADIERAFNRKSYCCSISFRTFAIWLDLLSSISGTTLFKLLQGYKDKGSKEDYTHLIRSLNCFYVDDLITECEISPLSLFARGEMHSCTCS